MPASSTGVDRADGPGGGLGLGDRLRSARKARAISLERIAEALNLDESVVISLEEERFEELGAPVFVRGHLKAYAKIVGLSPDVVLDAYGVMEPQAVTVPTVDRSVRRSVTINPMVWGVSSLLFLLGIVLAVYVLQDDDPEPVQAAAPDAATIAPVTADPAAPPVGKAGVEDAATVAPVNRQRGQAAAMAPEPTATAGEDEPIDVPAATAEVTDVVSSTEAEPVAAVPETPQPVIDPVARPQADLMRLSLHFREESWVEISDANRRLLFGLQREGRRRELSGEPPFRLLIGNAAGVDLSVNDQPYAVPSAGVTGKVARFEISAAAID